MSSSDQFLALVQIMKEMPTERLKTIALATASIAESRAKHYYPPNLLYKKDGDAFRHILWNALITIIEDDSWAKKITDRYEELTPSNDLLDKEMDYKNGAIGRTLGNLLKPKYSEFVISNIYKLPTDKMTELKGIIKNYIRRGNAYRIENSKLVATGGPNWNGDICDENYMNQIEAIINDGFFSKMYNSALEQMYNDFNLYSSSEIAQMNIKNPQGLINFKNKYIEMISLVKDNESKSKCEALVIVLEKITSFDSNLTGEYNIQPNVFSLTLRNAQNFLITLGYNLGSSGADGLWGNNTKKAVNDFESANSISNSDFLKKSTYHILEQRAGLETTEFWKSRRKTWVFPVKGGCTANPLSNPRNFGAGRKDDPPTIPQRKHAGVDLCAEEGREVIAMTDGLVVGFDPLFYHKTQAIEVQNDDGTIARYTEVNAKVKVGDRVFKGQVIATVKTSKKDLHMLHLEVYMNTDKGALTNRSNSSNYTYVPALNYQRRSDLINPEGVVYLDII